METSNSSTVSPKPPPLNSDQLNYLIWRYLQESGYADAAVKLQRDWRVQDAENLPFAKHIKGNALIKLVQMGLRYHHLSLTIDETGRPSKQLNPSMFFFGEESVRPPSPVGEQTPRPGSSHRAISPTGSTTTARRPNRDGGISGPSETTPQPTIKRGRKGGTATSIERNGSASTVTRKPSGPAATVEGPTSDVEMTNGVAAPSTDAKSPSPADGADETNRPLANGVAHDERMDVDTDEDTHALTREPEPIPAPIHTLTNGESVGIQVVPAKARNVSPSTTFLQTSQAKSVSRTLWRPNDPNIVVAVGDEFCTSWRLSGDGSSVRQNLLDSSNATIVSAAAWDASGSVLAVATYSNELGQLHLFDGQEMTLMETLPASQRPLTALQWRTSGLCLLAVAPADNQDEHGTSASSIFHWDISKGPKSTLPSTISVPELLLELDTATSALGDVLAAAGEGVVYLCQTSPNLIVKEKWVHEEQDAVQWAFIECSFRGEGDLTLIAGAADPPCIWLPNRSVLKKDVHEGSLTGLKLRPTFSSSPERQFATSSTDSTVKVWNFDPSTNHLSCIHMLTIGNASPIMAISYSPNGFRLAGASYNASKIWNAEYGYNHMASWQGENGSWSGATLRDEDVLSNGDASMNGDHAGTGLDHSLVWDSDSKRLAFGLASQIAIINIQR